MGKNNSKFGQHFPSRYLLVQIQQWKHLNNVWNLLKCNNDDTRTKSVMVFYLTLNRFSTLFSCFHFWFRTSTIPAGQLLLRIIIIKYTIAVKSQVIKHHNCRHCIIFWILGEGKPLKPKVKLTTKVKIRFHPYLVRQGKCLNWNIDQASKIWERTNTVSNVWNQDINLVSKSEQNVSNAIHLFIEQRAVWPNYES